MYRNRIILPIYFSVVGNLLPAAFRFSLFALPPLCAAEQRRLVRGSRRGLCERVARVLQPPDLPSNAGNRAAAANRGRLFFGYFLFGEAKESNLLPGNPRRS